MEKRNSKRIPISLEAQLIWDDKAHKVFVSDISKNGLYIMAVSGEKEFPNRAEKTLTVKFHISSKEFLELQCKEIWSDISHSSSMKIGLEVKNPPVEFKEFYRKSYYKVKKEISHDPIAVVGMACHYPGASDLKSFWENILTRRRQFRRIPAQRLPVSDYFDPDPLAPDKTYANRAAVIDGFEFDWVKRGIPKRVVESSDIVHWLALEVALRALEDAGYSRGELPGDRTGVILGNTLTGEHSRSQNMRLRWPYVEKVLKASASKKGLPKDLIEELVGRMETYYKNAFAPITEDTLAGNLSNTIAGRICNFLDLHGGGYTVDGACSSSLIAITTAARDLSSSTLDLAIVGGVDISLDTFELIGFAKTNALTKDEMRVYDRRASGFIPGEGAGFVVLKRLEDARADGNYIYAVLRGWGISSDGKGGITAPKAQTQALAIRRAYGKAGYSLSEVDFIEGHGTGTIAGDKAELEGVSSALGDSDENTFLRSCGLTSLKSIIGHTKAASGIGGFIKAVLSVNRRIIPPIAGCEEPNPVFQEKALGIYPVMFGEVRNADEPVRAGISGMGFGGINCHVTIESAGKPAKHIEPSIGERELLASYQLTELFVLSAESQSEIINKISQLKKVADGISTAELVDLSRHLTENLSVSKPFRLALIAKSPEGLTHSLNESELMLEENLIPEGKFISSHHKDIWIGNSVRRKRVGFLFPGQGSQQLNMGRFLIERYKWARDFVSKMDSLLAGDGYQRISEHIYKPLDRVLNENQLNEWKKTLSRSEIAQPAICMASLLWVRYLAGLGIKAVVAGGHSLGELTAFQVAGAFDEETLVRFAAFRGKLAAASDENSGTMASFPCGKEKVSEILKEIKGYAIIANINSPVQTVISGEKEAVEKAVQAGKILGVKAKYLPVSNAFHSRFMSQAATKISREAPIPELLKKSDIGLFTSTDGREVISGTDLKSHFSNQIAGPIDFISLVNQLRKNCDILVEVGPGRVLSDLANSITGETTCLPIESKAGDDHSLNVFTGYCFANGIDINWPVFFESRFTRPFKPASKRIFIENPCERPLPFAEEGTDSPVKPESGSGSVHVRKLVVDAQGIPRPDGYPLHSSRKTAGVTHKGPGDFNEENSFSLTAEIPKPEVLIRLASEITGFPAGSISLDHRLLDDLNLDSIKAGQFVARALKFYHAEGKIDPTSMPNSSLREIFERIDQNSLPAQGNIAAQMENEEEKRSGRILLPADENWVRNFRIAYTEQQRAGSSSLEETLSDLKKEKSRIFIVSDKASGICSEMEKILFRNGTPAASTNYENLGSSDLKDFNYVIFLLPAEKDHGLLRIEQVHRMAARMHSIASAINSNKARIPKPAYALVQFGNGDFYKSEKIISLEAKGSTAFLCSLYLENPSERIRVIEFCSKNETALVLRAVIEELRSEENFSMAAFDKRSVRRIPMLELAQTKKFPNRKIKWTRRDVVLVTGGARGITAECALAFAAKTGVKLALVGSTTLIDKDKEIQKVLERYRESKISYRYYACDITEKECIIDLNRRIEQDLGVITGIIHGAAMNRPRRAENVSYDQAIREIGPKLIGAINILEVLKDNPIKLLAGFGSIIGITGMIGNAWYGFSNELLNLLLDQFKCRNKTTEVIFPAFSIWDEVGMGKKMGSIDVLSGMGISPIPKDNGVAHFMQLMEKDPGCEQVLVASRLGSLNTFTKHPVSKPTADRFLEEIVLYEKGVEIKSRAVLTLEKDPYLKDHLFRGAYLFPAVFGLEAMAQAVSSVTGIDHIDHLRLENVRLTYPISIEPGQATEIHIHALVQDNAGPPGEIRIVSSIRVDQTGFSKDHFEAVFVLGKKTSMGNYKGGIPKTGLDIRPSEDLYGHMLFQGSSFQRIIKIREFSPTKCIFDSALELSDDSKGSAFVTGDPFFRDTLLQSGQLVLPDLVALPIEIGRWEIDLRGRKSGINSVVMNITDRDDDQITANVTVIDSRGRVIEKLSGYKAKIIEKLNNAPQVSDLISPEEWDESQINKMLQYYCTELNQIAPLIAIKYRSGLHKAKTTERHRIEAKLFQKAYKKLKLTYEGLPRKANVLWKKDGKPFIKESRQIAVSYTHDDRLLLCSSGVSEQGCDIEIIRDRGKEEWTGLLGTNREPLLEKISAIDNSIDRAGIRIWCALEALHKASGMRGDDLRYAAQIKEALLFESADSGILTFPVRLLRGPERMFAVVLAKGKSRNQNLPEMGRSKDTVKCSETGSLIDLGPQGQKIFSYQFPLGLKDSSGTKGGLYFTNYFHWVGHVRELALRPISKLVSDEVLNGRFMVTNHTETHISGNVRSDEDIDTQAWIEEISGPENSSLVLHFEWRRLLADGSIMPVAISKQQVSWQKASGHGVLRPTKCPDFFMEFLHKNHLIPEEKVYKKLPEQKNIFVPELGKSLYSNSLGKQKILEERIFETTIEQSSLAQNIYFANYFIWQGHLRDQFLFKPSPEQYRKMDRNGQFACVYSQIRHLHEAMPFDLVSVTMKLKQLYECGMDLYFEYFKLGSGGERIKLAYGTHTLAWVSLDSSDNYIPQRIPPFYLKQIMEMHGLSG